MPDATLEAAAVFRDRYRLRPDLFITEILGDQPYAKQVELAMAVVQYRRVSCVGANSSGKDFLTARLILWWLAVYEAAKVVVIGPSFRQVDEVVWRELRTAHRDARYRLGGHLLEATPHYEVSPERFAIGFTTDQPYNLQGFHSPHLLVVITEAHGVPQPQIEMVKMLNPERVVMTGNALSVSGEFYQAHNGRGSLYHAIKITAADTPNISEGRVVIPGMMTVQDMEERRKEWGEQSVEYRASVLAEFTVGAGRNYFDLEAVDRLSPGVLEPLVALRGGAIKVWRPPVVGGRYVAGMDCAWGEKGAYDVLTVADWQTGEQMAEIYGRLPDDEMAQESVNLLTKYGKAFVGVEANSEGRHVVDKMLALGYGDRMYHRDAEPSPQAFLLDGRRPPKRPGWITDASTRPVMLRELEEAVRGGQLVVRCQHAIDEMRTFIRDDRGRPGPAEGHYADHVVSWAILWQMRKYATFGAAAGQPHQVAANRRW